MNKFSKKMAKFSVYSTTPYPLIPFGHKLYKQKPRWLTHHDHAIPLGAVRFFINGRLSMRGFYIVELQSGWINPELIQFSLTFSSPGLTLGGDFL